MTKQLWAATRALLVLTVILGVSYPLVITAVGRLMPGPAAGSIITVNGQPVGSALSSKNNQTTIFCPNT